MNSSTLGYGPVRNIREEGTTSFRSHVTCVTFFSGPKSNPAALCTTADTTIKQLFSHLFRAAVASENRIKFLSRFDKSATNIKESSIWTSIGQTPWSYPYSFFYHVVPAFPYQALEAAAKLGEYTLVDRGTWYGVEDWVRDEMMVFV